MLPKQNLLGQKFGRLTVISEAPNHGRHIYWHCLCSCGKQLDVRSDNLRNGRSQSCGCLHREKLSKRETKHGMARTRLYRIWRGVLQRCEDSHRHEFKRYGGRGIKVCEEWHAFETFRDWALENGYSDDLTIDRIDVNGNYCPENCRWVTMKIQGQNRRTNIVYKGLPLIVWCEKLNISPKAVRGRLERGWSFERALYTPVKHRK